MPAARTFDISEHMTHERAQVVTPGPFHRGKHVIDRGRDMLSIARVTRAAASQLDACSSLLEKKMRRATRTEDLGGS